jgi:uncharacterized protein YdhG (YjbR/CyaY superfamily)
MSTAQKPADASTGTDDGQTFTAEERAAMKERAREVRSEKRRGASKVEPEHEVLAKIAEMTGTDRAMAERVHAIVQDSAPQLAPRLWYGMPAYATPGKAGKVVCFFQAAEKFGARYATLGFNDVAQLDDGTMWPTAFALTGLSDGEEARIRELVVRAAG